MVTRGWLVPIGIFFFVAAVALTGAWIEGSRVRNAAIEAGVAEWRCDKHGQTTFHFIERREP